MKIEKFVRLVCILNDKKIRCTHKSEIKDKHESTEQYC